MHELLHPPVSLYPRQKPGLVSEERCNCDEAIWIDQASGSSYALNLMASAILDLCGGSRTIEAIAALIGAALPSDPAAIERDTRAILAEFAAYGLIGDAGSAN